VIQAIEERCEKPRLAAVLCALCGYPVSHMTKVTNALAGGICTREECRKNRKTGKDREVFTFNRMVDEL
jgi:hypothetical protein